ncbi:MAG: class I SAM-dependent methyltransferase [Bacteroidetes bacterium]|nr:class I SAM-dependent methyltransferase [Bacteroidota bacterium]
MSTEQVFTEIYRSKHWKSTDNVSGPGSEINQTETLIRELNGLFKELNIVSVLDIPCGNFHWMQKVNLSKTNYVGADIVTELIESNKQNYQESDRLNFQVLNLITDPLPQCDLIIVRDCLVHFSNKDILNAITNIKSSGSKYLLTTTFTNHHMNFDIVTGDWRPLNLQDKPFNFAPPLMIINENCTECNGEFKDKSMALWEISKL